MFKGCAQPRPQPCLLKQRRGTRREASQELISCTKIAAHGCALAAILAHLRETIMDAAARRTGDVQK